MMTKHPSPLQAVHCPANVSSHHRLQTHGNANSFLCLQKLCHELSARCCPSHRSPTKVGRRQQSQPQPLTHPSHVRNSSQAYGLAYPSVLRSSGVTKSRESCGGLVCRRRIVSARSAAGCTEDSMLQAMPLLLIAVTWFSIRAAGHHNILEVVASIDW